MRFMHLELLERTTGISSSIQSFSAESSSRSQLPDPFLMACDMVPKAGAMA